MAEAELRRREKEEVGGATRPGPPLRRWAANGGKTNPHVVEGDADALGEVLAEQRDLRVALAEVVQRDEGGVHPHAHADGLRRRAVGQNRRETEEAKCIVGMTGGKWAGLGSLLTCGVSPQLPAPARPPAWPRGSAASHLFLQNDGDGGH